MRGIIASRLREERLRLEPHQGRFAERLGLKQGKYSSLETGNREAKAEDLAAAAKAGVDVHYVLTGRRAAADSLDERAAELLDQYLGLPPQQQQLALALVKTVTEHAASAPEAPRRTIHDRQLEYHADGTR